MLHRDVLKLLFPAEIAGDFEADIALEGVQLDTSQERSDALLSEIFADMSAELLAAWERVCGFVYDPGDPVAVRQERVLRKLREKGALSKAYYMAQAQERGAEITIDETPCKPFKCGSRCGDHLYVKEAIFVWKADVLHTDFVPFRCGSRCGERILWWDRQDGLVSMLRDRKPAHTHLLIGYVE
jgi:uncharacterized protein YmfQ (DUF2313 family)